MLDAAEDAVRKAGVAAGGARAIGITNQRETTVLWERATGRPVAPAIVWQDRRTAERCRELPAELIRARTGLVPDPYFSATKLEWLLARTDVPRAELAFGTVDSWLVWKLTGGRVHATDMTNASRTMLLDLDTLEWDDELLDAVRRRPRRCCPGSSARPRSSARRELLGVTLPIAGIAGDQQAALFGHGCFERGEAKATYGTGSFVLVNVGPAGAGAARACSRRPRRPAATRSRARSSQRRRDPVAARRPRHPRGRGRERAARAEVESRAASTSSPRSPASARRTGTPTRAALITGLTRGTTRAHIVRAALEAMAFQVADVLDVLPGGVERAARRRRRERERLPDAVPGRRARLPGRGRGGAVRRPRSAPPRSPASRPGSGPTRRRSGRGSCGARSTSRRPIATASPRSRAEWRSALDRALL